MYKGTVSMLVLITLMLVHLASADYLVYNGSKTEKAYVVYAYYDLNKSKVGSQHSAVQVYRPPGYRVQGHYIVEPGTFKNLSVPDGTTDVYVRIRKDGQVIKPNRPASKNFNYTFNVTNKAFSSLELTDGKIYNFSGKGVNKSDFVRESGFYSYKNGGVFNLGGPLKYGTKTVGLNVNGHRTWGGTKRRWTRTFSAPGKVLYYRATNILYHGSGKAEFSTLTGSGNRVTAKGIVEDGGRINSDITATITIYYRK